MAELELSKTQRILLEQISPNPYQPRKEFDDNGIAELAESIKAQGLVQKIVVIPQVDKKFKIIPEKYHLIAGERRLRAYQKLYKDTSERRFSAIEAVVESVDQLDPESYKNKLIFDSLAENLNRQDLTPVEKAEAILKIQKETGKTYKEIGETLGMKESSIKSLVSIYNRLDESQRDKVKKERMGERKIKKELLGKGKKEEKGEEKLGRPNLQRGKQASKTDYSTLSEEEKMNELKEIMVRETMQMLGTKDEGQVFEFLGDFFKFYIDDYTSRHLKSAE